MNKRWLFTHGTEVVLLGALGCLPLAINTPYALGLLTLLTIYGVCLIGLDVTVGYLGQINLAQAAFLGLGAYAASLSVTHFGLGIVAALGFSFVSTFLVGGLLAFPALRLDGPQFALATLSFSAITTTTLNEMEWLTQGAQGLHVTRPDLWGWQFTAAGFYWMCLAILALVWLTMRNLLNSQWGRAFEALRDSPIATDAIGVGTYRHKIAGFAIGSALGGLAGGLYAFNFQYLQPSSFGYDLMIILLLGVVLGGRKNLWGAVVGAALIVLLPNLLSNPVVFRSFALIGVIIALLSGLEKYRQQTLRSFQALAPILAMVILAVGALLIHNTEDWRKAIFALMLFAVVVGLPEGLMGFATRRLAQLFHIDADSLPPSLPLEKVLRPQTQSPQRLLEIQQLKHHFGGVKALNDISLHVMTGQIHGLIGPNGSGKSTLVNLITGLYSPSGGTIRFRGQPLPLGSLYKIAHSGIARTFQNLQLFSELSALENVMLALRDHYRVPLALLLLGLGKQQQTQAQAKALALLEWVGIHPLAQQRAKDLPYGAQRLLEIARALACHPALLILDEPAAGLAHPDITRLVEVIRHIRQCGITIILIEHHMDVVSELCDVVTVLDGGKIIASGTPEAIKREPAVVNAYLGVSC
ncbi:MAG: branched-chain amino acid ABC transporter ATP-binding protein/permease [Gammaproteobacteria bacterium]|nr:branched-chain amino acid ABC transporter ATP-binding protein/permease [Gammaproteobacteria bacterium]